jgi:predicted DNA-binding protein
MSHTHAVRVSQSFRLPKPVADALAELAERDGRTKSEIVVEAILRMDRERTEALMAEGFRELAEEDRARAEGGIAAAREVFDRW